MTVSSTATRRVQYNGNGVTTAFAVPFVFFDSSDLKVYKTVVLTGVETLQVLTTNYTVSGGGTVAATGTVTMTTAPATGTVITILSSISPTQPDEFSNTNQFDGDVLTKAFDRGMLVNQDALYEKITRAILKSEGSIGTGQIQLGTPIPGYLTVWGVDGSTLQSVNPSQILVSTAITAAPGLVTATDINGTFVARSISGTSNQISVSNGDGVSGSPTLSLPSAITAPGSLVTTTSLASGTNISTGNQGEVRFNDANSSNYVGFKSAATVGSNVIWTLPASDGSLGQTMVTDGAGVLSWGAGGGSGGGATVAITQASHGFVVGDVLYLNSTTYTKARADAAATAESVGMVSAVAGVNNFTLSAAGQVNNLTGLTAGTPYFISPITAGAITAIEPTTVGHISKPIGIADSTTSLILCSSMRGYTVGSVLAAGTQAQLEAASSTAVYVTPGRQHFHPGMAKAVGRVTNSAGTYTLQSTTSYNITSISKTGTGVITVNLTTSMADTNYIVQITTDTSATSAYYTATSSSVITVNIKSIGTTPAAIDSGFSITIFGDM